MGKTLFELLQENGSFEITKETTIGDLNSAVVEAREDKEEAFSIIEDKKHIHDFMHVLVFPIIGRIASTDLKDELLVAVVDVAISTGTEYGEAEMHFLNENIEDFLQNLIVEVQYTKTNILREFFSERQRAEQELKPLVNEYDYPLFEKLTKYALLISYMVQSLDESKDNWGEKLPYQLMENDERKQLFLSQIVPQKITFEEFEKLSLQVCYDLAKYGESQQLEKDHPLNRTQSPSERLDLTQGKQL